MVAPRHRRPLPRLIDDHRTVKAAIIAYGRRGRLSSPLLRPLSYRCRSPRRRRRSIGIEMKMTAVVGVVLGDGGGISGRRRPCVLAV